MKYYDSCGSFIPSETVSQDQFLCFKKCFDFSVTNQMFTNRRVAHPLLVPGQVQNKFQKMRIWVKFCS